MLVCKLPPELKKLVTRHAKCVIPYGERTRCGDRLIASMGRAGVKWIGSGYYRHVFRYRKDCIVKVAKDIEGVQSNKDEFEAWNHRIPPRAKRFFAPIDEAGIVEGGKWPWYVTQPKAELDSPALGFEHDKNIIGRIKTDIGKEGLACLDLHGGNVGKLHGKYVLIDYGSGLTKCPSIDEETRRKLIGHYRRKSVRNRLYKAT